MTNKGQNQSQEHVNKRILAYKENQKLGLHKDQSKDLTNKRFGRLKVIKRSKKIKNSNLWLCKCDCGKDKAIRVGNLLSGSTTSCGCYAIEQRKKSVVLPHGEASFNRLVSEYKQGAKSRGLLFNLTKSETLILFKGNCYYCGIEAQQYFKGDWAKAYNGIFYYNGIDRRDNSLGYLKENCVSCCTICNRAKHALSSEVFDSWVDRLTTYKLLARA